MRSFDSKRFRRFVAIGLLASLVPTLLQPAFSSTRYNRAERHVEWLRSQLKGETSEAIDVAIESAIDVALAQNTHNLSLFLEAFVDAYLVESGSDIEQSHTDAVLFALLHRHWHDVTSQGIMSGAYFKALQARTSVAKDRTLSSLFTLVKDINHLGPVYGNAAHTSTHAFLHLSSLLFSTVVPRGP